MNCFEPAGFQHVVIGHICSTTPHSTKQAGGRKEEDLSLHQQNLALSGSSDSGHATCNAELQSSLFFSAFALRLVFVVEGHC